NLLTVDINGSFGVGALKFHEQPAATKRLLGRLEGLGIPAGAAVVASVAVIAVHCIPGMGQVHIGPVGRISRRQTGIGTDEFPVFIDTPLKYIGLKNAVHTFAMMMTIALRFIPTLIEEAEKIMNAQKARGADLENGSLVERVKALIPILIPLLISSVRRAYELAEAMECRCYNGGEGKTRMKQLKMSSVDLYAIIFIVVFAALVITLNIIF
ncbi:MAG: energy-coupling factor transporter transmembrane protein EcfT, partial [Clostridia bacterium]|nr:energy-coupling factor transporter transmembrane protein EcfT [Clostridia bacterium]